jgi:hypothetical protein
MPLETETKPTPVMTQEQCDALAARIAAVLGERKKIGDERRRQELEYRRRNSDRAMARYYKLRGEFREQAESRVKEIDRVYDTIMSSNAAA